MTSKRRGRAKPARTFGLPNPQPMSVAELDDVLGQMQDHVAQVYESVANRIDDQLVDMAAGVQSVRKKVDNGILGHLRQLNGQLNSVASRIANDIDSELQWLQGTVEHVEKARYTPRPRQTVPTPMDVPRGPGIQLYTVLASPDCNEWRAVPGDMGDWYSRGWSPPPGWTVQGVFQASPQTVKTVLNAWVETHACKLSSPVAPL